MSNKAVELITLDKANYLGLKAEADQRPDSRLKSRRYPWISRSGMTPRLDIKREAYLAIYKDFKASEHGYARIVQHLKTVLVNLSTGVENPLASLDQSTINDLIQVYPSVAALKEALSVEDRRQYEEFHNTLGDAQRNNGVLWVGGDRNKHLANILTVFTYLYGTKPQDNPLMHNYGGSTHETAQDLLFRDLRKAKSDVDIESPENRRKAVEQYMERISGSIVRIIKMTPQELEQTFPDDNVKHKAIVRKLKNEFNRLAVQVNYNYRFKNLPDEFNDKSENYLLVKLNPGDKFYQFLEAKFSWRIKKKVLLVLAIVFALFIAAGQAAIAVFALTSIAAMVAIGASSFVTNTLLFFRDIKAMLISIFSGRLFNGMKAGLKVFVGVFFSFSLVTGIVTGGLAFVALVGLSGAAVISTAPWWVLVGAGIVGGLTVIGITALMFMAGVSLARALRGNSFKDLIKGAAKSIKSFFEVPLFNQSLVNLIKERRALETQLSARLDHLEENPSEETVALQAKISAITGEIRVEKMSHYVRHFTKVIVKIVLVPFAIIAAGVATVALMTVTAKATAATLKALFSTWSDVVSTTVANVLTWGPALVVRGTLNTKNLVSAAGFIAAKVSKAVSGGVYTLGIIGSLTRHGLLFKAVKASFQIVRNNPLKTIVPGIRTAIAAVLCALVALNGYGNGQTAKKGGTWFDDFLPSFLPDWITGNPGIFAAICGTSSSIALNLMSVNNTTLTNTPMQHLDKKAEPPPQEDQQDEELIPWGTGKSANKGPALFGHTPSVRLKVVGFGVDKTISEAHDKDSVPLLSSSTAADDDELIDLDSAFGSDAKFEVFEEWVEQRSYLCR